MRYRGKDFDMHDAWFLNVDGVLHAFHLRNYHPDAVHTEWPIGHIVSRDLLHFEALPDILPRSEKSNGFRREIYRLLLYRPQRRVPSDLLHHAG